MSRLQLLLISITAISILTTAFALSSFSTYSSGSSSSNEGRKATAINTPHGVYQTTGDILNPTSQVIGGNKTVIDPMKYLRTFNYGRVSTLSNGTTVQRIYTNSIR